MKTRAELTAYHRRWRQSRAAKVRRYNRDWMRLSRALARLAKRAKETN